MNDCSDLVINGEILDISYRTEKPEEVIHPRVTGKLGAYQVYCQKKTVSLESFLNRLANNEEGLWVAGYRKASGKKIQSTITFSKRNRLIISSRLQQLLGDIKTGAPSFTSTTSAETGTPDSGTSSGNLAKPFSLEDLQRKLKRQEEIGLLGEDAALRYEHLRLTEIGCRNPDHHIEHTAVKNVSAGYDIKSEFNGEIRYIEVKSSTTRTNSFFISENERIKLSALRGDAYLYLVRVDELDKKNSNVIREIRNPFGPDGLVTLEPTAWFATISKR